MSTEIKNYNTYNMNMAKSLLDKVFFMDKIECDYVLDFGCADGVLIEFLQNLFPDVTYVGYDIDEKMLELAGNRCPDAYFTDDLDTALNLVKVENTAVLLSSVLHEVHTYSNRTDIDKVWDFVFGSQFKNVVIRDMIPAQSIDRPVDVNDYCKILNKADSGQIQEFKQIWGSLENNKNMIHYLLKYRYEENWEREVSENYFPLSRETLLAMIPDEYKIEFHEHFTLPFFKRSVMKDFGIEIRDNTHMKLILERR